MYSGYDYPYKINLVCVLFGTAIPTSSFNFILLFLYLHVCTRAYRAAVGSLRRLDKPLVCISYVQHCIYYFSITLTCTCQNLQIPSKL